MQTKRVAIGRIVHFNMPDGQRRPAIVVNVNPDQLDGDGLTQTQSCDLQVFTNGGEGVNECGIAPHQRQILEGDGPLTWCWPTMAEAGAMTCGPGELKAAA